VLFNEYQGYAEQAADFQNEADMIGLLISQQVSWAGEINRYASQRASAFVIYDRPVWVESGQSKNSPQFTFSPATATQ
jgi:hypothetical protein